MEKAFKICEKTYRMILVIMTASIVIIGVYQVLGRYFSELGFDTSWTEETMRYIYVGIIMLGLATVTREESFTTITVVRDIVKKRSKVGYTLLYCFQNVVQIICFALMFYLSIKLVLDAGGRVSAVTRISFIIIYAPIPIGALLSMIFSILNFARKLAENKKKEED